MAAVLVTMAPAGEAHAFGVAEAENNLDPFPTNPGDPISGGSGVVTVELGLNVASGHFTCQGFGCTDNFDSFRMLVPEGLEITFSEFRVPRSAEPNGFEPGVPEQFFVFASDGVSVIQPVEVNGDWKSPNLIGITVFPNVAETFTVVLGPGYYDVVAANCCPPDGIVGGGSWEASFTATIAVPEVGAAALMTLAFAASGVLMRNRRPR
jgi:hypothetical protein